MEKFWTSPVGVAWAVALLLALASPAAAIPDTGLVISEIFFDVVGGDDQRQWLELYNDTGADIDLSSYSLGFGRADYTRTTVQLSGTIFAGATFVVGGLTSDAANFNPVFDQAIDFDPNARRGNNNGRPDGVALFNLLATDIVRGSDPIHTVIYGEATATPRPWLTDESGLANSGVVSVILPASGIAGQSIALQSDGSWIIDPAPTPNSAPLPEPKTGFLVQPARSPRERSP